MIKAIKGLYNKAVSKIKDKVDEISKTDADQKLLSKWQSKLEDAMSDHNTFRSQCAINDEQYNNSKTVTNAVKDARQVVGLTFQLIESQQDITIPSPRVDELEESDADRKKMIEGQLKHFSESDELKLIVSENGRITSKNSYSIMKVCYDPDYDGHTYKGKIKIVNPHPVNVVFQKNITRIKEMNHLWHIENRSIDNVCLEYGEDFRDDLELDGAEYSYLEDFSELTRRESTASGMVSVIECWYKDKDGDVNVLTWANDVILAHKKQFYYKKDLELIEGKYYETVSMEQYDETGVVVGYQDVKVCAKVPKDFPFIIQYNIPKEKSIRGKADPEIIVDQQEAIKKVLSNEEERLLKGNTKILTRKGSGLASKINNSITQILETDNPTQDVYVIDMKTSDRSLKDYYQLMVSAAKDGLGVTDAGQGIIQNNKGLSGRAIEQLSNNSNGRLATKIFQKHIAFSQMYRMCYDFMIAFYDDKRPYKFGEGQSKQYGYFNKSTLCKQDDAGEWYYPDFYISITTDSGIPKDPRFMLDFINGSGDRMDNVEYWTMAEKIGISGASEILEMEKRKCKCYNNNSLNPDEIKYLEDNPQLMQQFIMQSQGGGISG